MPKSTKKKNKLIIQNSSSSSSSSTDSLKKGKKKRNLTVILSKKGNSGKTVKSKKNILIIDSSSSSLKEKIEPFLPEIIASTKTNLKISPERKTMITTKNERLNEKFIDLMEKLSEIMLKQGEPFRARAYQKAQETIMAYPSDITSPNDLNGKPGIGSTIMEKLNEFVETGTLKILEKEKNNPINILADVYGIGPKKQKN